MADASSILLNVPGDAAAIMTTLDGYPMAKQGKVALRLYFRGQFIYWFNDCNCRDNTIRSLLAQWSLAFGPADILP